MTDQKSLRGFTLTELVITVSVISIIIIPVLFTSQRGLGQSRNSERVNTLESLKFALEVYYKDHGKYPGCPAGGGGSYGFNYRQVTNNVCTGSSYPGGLSYENSASGGFVDVLIREGYLDTEEQWQDPLNQPLASNSHFNCRYVVPRNQVNPYGSNCDDDDGDGLTGDLDSDDDQTNVQQYFIHCFVEGNSTIAQSDGGFRDEFYEVWGPGTKPFICIVPPIP